MLKINTITMKTIIFATIISFFGCSTNNNSNVMKRTIQVDNFAPSDSILKTGWYYLADSAYGFKRKLDRDTVFYFIKPVPIVTAKNIIETKIYTDRWGGKGLSMKLDSVGTKSWSTATEETINKHLAFIIDNVLVQVPKVNAKINGGMTALNRGDVYANELDKIKATIDSERK